MKIFKKFLNGESIGVKISRFSFGFIIFQLISKAGVAIINPSILIIFDLKIALILMFLISLLIRYLMILSYDKAKIDWLLIEKFKSYNENGIIFPKKEINRTIKIINFFSSFGRFALISFLITYDPFLTVVYQRKGYYEWNKIPNYLTFILFIISTFVCTLISASWIKPVLNFLLN